MTANFQNYDVISSFINFRKSHQVWKQTQNYFKIGLNNWWNRQFVENLVSSITEHGIFVVFEIPWCKWFNSFNTVPVKIINGWNQFLVPKSCFEKVLFFSYFFGISTSLVIHEIEFSQFFHVVGSLLTHQRWKSLSKLTAWKVKFSFKDYIRKHAVFWSFTPEYCMFSDVILKGKLHFSCSDCYFYKLAYFKRIPLKVEDPLFGCSFKWPLFSL